jgi:hypothetical protein
MAIAANPHDLGQVAAELADQVKALLRPLEKACRYRELRSEDTATFDVRPAQKTALAFSIAIAPGGINIDSSAFSIRELAVEQADIALALVDAILAGRLRQVRQVKANGKARATKTYVFDPVGHLLFKHRRSVAMAAITRVQRTERLRFDPYA